MISLNCIVGSNGKFLKKVVGNMFPFVGFPLTTWVKNHVLGYRVCYLLIGLFPAVLSTEIILKQHLNLIENTMHFICQLK